MQMETVLLKGRREKQGMENEKMKSRGTEETKRGRSSGVGR